MTARFFLPLRHKRAVTDRAYSLEVALLPKLSHYQCNIPLAKGDGREAAGGRSHTPGREFQFAYSSPSLPVWAAAPRYVLSPSSAQTCLRLPLLPTQNGQFRVTQKATSVPCK